MQNFTSLNFTFCYTCPETRNVWKFGVNHGHEFDGVGLKQLRRQKVKR